MESKLEEAEWVQARLDQLNPIKGKSLVALCHRQLYQKRMIKAHNKKMRPQHFQEDELMLKKIFPIQKYHCVKWIPNYEGHYMVKKRKKAFSGRALILTNMNNKELPLLVN